MVRWEGAGVGCSGICKLLPELCLPARACCALLLLPDHGHLGSPAGGGGQRVPQGQGDQHPCTGYAGGEDGGVETRPLQREPHLQGGSRRAGEAGEHGAASGLGSAQNPA